MADDDIAVFICEDAEVRKKIIAHFFASGITYVELFKKESRSKLQVH